MSDITPLMTLTIASHFFKITQLSPRAREAVLMFAQAYVKYGYKQVRRGREVKFVRVAEAVYGSATADREEYRFHINQLSEFKELLKRQYILDNLIKIVYKNKFEGKTVPLIMREGWDPRDYQLPILEYLDNNTGCMSKFIGIQTGKGKDQPLDAKIKIPGGWSTMGEMHIGKEIIAKDGSVTKVIDVFPQGKKDVYKITFWDGRSTECGLEHLWKVFNVNTTIKQRWKIVTTEEIIRLLKVTAPRLYIDLVESEDNQDSDLELDPYSLGVYIGDGCSRSGANEITITTPDEFIINEMRKNIHPDYEIRTRMYKYKCAVYSIAKSESCSKILKNPFKQALIDFGLINKYSHEKFIPAKYLNASRNQRLCLLQGLMDTDGTCTAVGSSSYSTTSQQLATDVQYLVRSLGGIANITSRITQYSHRGEKKDGKRCYDVDIRYKKPSELFRLPKKKERTNDSNQYADILKLRIKSVEKIGEKETQCISIEHPDRLYVTDDFIVTHNTFLSLKSAAAYGKRIVIVVRPMFMDKWVLDVPQYLDIDPKRIMSVRGSSELQALLELQRIGKLEEIDVILISNKTIQNWFKLYQEFKDGVLDQGYACSPEDLYEFLECGLRLIDEVHMDFHLNFKIDLFTNIPKSVSLSATLDNKDPFMKKMYEIAYPLATRYKQMEIDKYAIARCVMYYLQEDRKIKTVENGGNNYSHNAFEESIMKDEDFLQSYLKLIKYTVEIGYIKDYVKGERAIIFAYKTELCGLIAEHLAAAYPHLDIRRYVSEDPIENMNDPDIRVTTLGSGSTAHDIARLKTAIMTVNVDSLQSNIQAFGRLRKIEGLTPRFYYFTCADVPKHMTYHDSKLVILQERALNFNYIQPPFSV